MAQEKIVDLLPQFHGCCILEKALSMMKIVEDTKPNLCVELGVYGGSSLFPVALQVQELQQKDSEYKPCVVAVDPWSPTACGEGWKEDDNVEWKRGYRRYWTTQAPLQRAKENFFKYMVELKLEHIILVKQSTSDEAVSQFKDGSIHFLHIDGNHSEEQAFRDVVNYLPKLAEKAYVVFDDSDWSTCAKAITELTKHGNIIKRTYGKHSYLIFRKD